VIACPTRSYATFPYYFGVDGGLISSFNYMNGKLLLSTQYFPGWLLSLYVRFRMRHITPVP
jgi:hypothetical protein